MAELKQFSHVPATSINNDPPPSYTNTAFQAHALDVNGVQVRTVLFCMDLH